MVPYHAVPILVVVCGHDGDLLALPVDVGDAVEGVGGDAPHRHALQAGVQFHRHFFLSQYLVKNLAQVKELLETTSDRLGPSHV